MDRNPSYFCVEFARVDGNNGTFITEGYKDWKYALDVVRKHDNPTLKSSKSMNIERSTLRHAEYIWSGKEQEN